MTEKEKVGDMWGLTNSPSALGLHTPTCAQAGSGAAGGNPSCCCGRSACRRCPELLPRERLVALSNSPSALGLHTPTCAQAGSGAVGGDGRLVGVLSVRLVGVLSVRQCQSGLLPAVVRQAR